MEALSPRLTVDARVLLLAANSGAGGSGRRGLPPYCEEGVPGLGLPFISAGSNWTFGGGGLENSVDALDGVQDRVGDDRPLALYAT